MREVIYVNENHEKYEELVKVAKDAINDKRNARILARGTLNKKPEITPIMEEGDITFYIGHDASGYTIFEHSSNADSITNAVQNTIDAARIYPLMSLVESFDGMMNCKGSRIDEWRPDLTNRAWVLSNEQKRDGAGILFCDKILHEIWEKIGDYYIAPSSIHELMIIKGFAGCRLEDISSMVKEINHSQVSDGEMLSDSAFFYDGSLKD